MASQSVSTPSLGIVKQVLSGDSVVIRDRPVSGPPPERTIVLSNISCGRLARKPNPSNQIPNVEDPFAWKAREFVRSKLIGKEVCYVIEKELPNGRHYGSIYLGKSQNGENIAISLLAQGLAELRKAPNLVAAEKSDIYKQYLSAEETAKAAGVGRWSGIPDTHRNVIWSIDEPKAFLDRLKGVRLPGIVEYVRDGSTLQVTLLPEKSDVHLEGYYVVWLTLSGIRTPAIRIEDGTQVPEPFGLDAQFFVESRLLQREVHVLLESCQNQNFFGTILHPNGNIAVVLLREGLAKCIDWSLSLVSVPGAADSYKAAELLAKTKRLRLWQNMQAMSAAGGLAQGRSTKVAPGVTLNGHILEVGNGDNVTVKCSDGITRKFFLSSIRGPKPIHASKTSNDTGSNTRLRLRPLYDVPYAFEAREHLRPFVGKSASILVDYIQPKTATITDERVCCTVTCGAINLAESLVAEGLATVLTYRNSDDSRSAAYLDLKAAEEKAISKGLGLHSKNDPPVHRISDLTNNLPKARQFFAFFKRTPRMDAIVEFIPHASRMRLYLPRETCLVTLLLGGIQCPRKRPGKTDGTGEEDVPFASEAATFVKELCTQRNIEISIENMDRVGNFIGWAFIDTCSDEPSTPNAVKSAGKRKKKTVEQAVTKPKTSINLLLVSKGFAIVHRSPSTEASPYYHDLLKAEESAKAQKLGLWSMEDFMQSWLNQIDDPGYINDSNEDSAHAFPGGVSASYLDDISALNLKERQNDSNAEDDTKIQWIAAQVTAMSKPTTGSEGLRFFAQHVSDSSSIVQISESLNSPAPTLSPNYRPKKGDIFAACFTCDDCWYRARIVKQDAKSITVQYIDFGNEEIINSANISSRTAPLTGNHLMAMPPKAREYRLALVQLPPDEADRACAERVFANAVMNKEILLAVRFDAIPCANETAKPVPAVSVKVPSAPIAGSSASVGLLDVSHFLIEEGLVCIEPMRANLIKHVPRALLSGYLEAQNKAKKERKNVWRYGDFRVDSTS